MDTRLRSFIYDVEIKPTKVSVDSENKHKYTEDGKITISTAVKVSDTVDIKQSAENVPVGKIKPYGLDTDAAYDVEVKEKVEPAVIQEHIEKAVKTNTKKRK